MLKLRILPYKSGSQSAKAVAEALNGLRVRFGGTFRPTASHLVVNWGCHDVPKWWTKGINPPNIVGRSRNKAIALKMLQDAGVSVPEFTSDAKVARQWWANKSVVVGRHALQGQAGAGIEVFCREERPEEPSGCPLYTKHIRHKREFRIHVFDGRVIDGVEKKKENGAVQQNAWIRNHQNGWVFCRDGVNAPQIVEEEAIKAVKALGLDFGAVDIGYREKEDKAFVFEVNTAPGIEGTTIARYARAIKTRLEA